MSTTAILDENLEQHALETPGMKLATVRKKKGYSCDHVAAKLHLRVRVIELLESDDYDALPEAVFIKGYMRAYAKLLEISPDPIIEAFNQLDTVVVVKADRHLWQSRRNTHQAERIIKAGTALFAVVVLLSVVFWWHKSKEGEALISETVSQATVENGKIESDVKLTDLSKMRSLLSSNSESKSRIKPHG